MQPCVHGVLLCVLCPIFVVKEYICYCFANLLLIDVIVMMYSISVSKDSLYSSVLLKNVS